MKKTLALLAVATLLISASGCGRCRGLCSRSSVATVGPFYGRPAPRALAGPCCPTYAPSCNTCDPCNTCNTCQSAPSCGCESGSQVMYGYNGSMAEMPIADGSVMANGTVIETTPIDVTNVGGDIGQ